MARSTPPAHRPRRKLRTGPFWKDAAAAGLPVLACFLGGATEKWAEGAVVALLGLLLVTNPPRYSLGVWFNGIALVLLTLGAVAFLPSAWFFVPDWRTALLNDFNIGIASTVSPQPWITFGCWLSLAAGLCWLYYVAGQEVENRGARRQLRVFAGGIIVLAAVAIALYLRQGAPSFWHNERGFGPFPNRNQTADLFGITSILVLACGQEEIRQGKRGWVLWLLGLAVLMVAIVLNFSRAGIAILVAGSALWTGTLVLRTRSLAKIAIGASAFLVLLTVMLMFGGQTLERFNFRGATNYGVSTDFRWLVFRDTFDLLRASPWCGIGLGNFEPVFAVFRNASIGSTRALHPESDWLWLAAEIGWPAVLVIIAGAALLVPRVFPLADGTNMRLRLAAFIGAILFALHGLADVSGHRVGSAYAGLFLSGLALRRPLVLQASVWFRNSFRFFGLCLLIVGFVWVLTSSRGIALPGGIGVEAEKGLATRANIAHDFSQTIVHSTRGLEWAPLNWQLYFLRALAKVGANRPSEDALDDFRRARFLEPNSPEIPYQEGMAWITRSPLLTMTAWREALRRARLERPELYARMLSAASQLNPPLNVKLEEFGSVQPDLVLIFLTRATGASFDSAVRRLLEHDSTLQSLTTEQKSIFFRLWGERGNAADLSAFVAEHPEFLVQAWRGIAREKARQQDFREAVRLTRQFAAPPALPRIAADTSIKQLQQNVYANLTNYEAGAALCRRQIEESQTDDALVTARRFTAQENAPAYFHYLEAECWAAKENWERAWAAWEAFEAARVK